MRHQAIRHVVLPGRSRALAAALAALVVGACGLFEDTRPSMLSFRMSRDDGSQALAVYATDFVAGVDVNGTTRVQVFDSDTVLHTLPFDTVFDIGAEQQWFVQVQSVAGDTLDVSVYVGVDGRDILSESGGIFPNEPWNYVYVFNQTLGTEIDVTF